MLRRLPHPGAAGEAVRSIHPSMCFYYGKEPGQVAGPRPIGGLLPGVVAAWRVDSKAGRCGTCLGTGGGGGGGPGQSRPEQTGPRWSRPGQRRPGQGRQGQGRIDKQKGQGVQGQAGPGPARVDGQKRPGWTRPGRTRPGRTRPDKVMAGLGRHARRQVQLAGRIQLAGGYGLAAPWPVCKQDQAGCSFPPSPSSTSTFTPHTRSLSLSPARAFAQSISPHHSLTSEPFSSALSRLPVTPTRLLFRRAPPSF